MEERKIVLEEVLRSLRRQLRHYLKSSKIPTKGLVSQRIHKFIEEGVEKGISELDLLLGTAITLAHQSDVAIATLVAEGMDPTEWMVKELQLTEWMVEQLGKNITSVAFYLNSSYPLPPSFLERMIWWLDWMGWHVDWGKRVHILLRKYSRDEYVRLIREKVALWLPDMVASLPK